MFFFPFSDDNPTHNKPYVCYFLITICIFIFLWQSSLPTTLNNQAVYNFGVVPAALLGDQESYISPILTIFTSMFMHGSWMHLIGNMVFLWIFGDNIEDSLGRTKFIIFYLLSGIGAALLQGIIDPTSSIPMIGASGAIAGVLGGYLLMHPKANVNVLMWIIIFISVIRVPAFIVLGFWIVGQFFNASFTSGSGVAYFAHIGGFIVGILLIPFLKKPEISLFQEAHSKPFQATNFDFKSFQENTNSDNFMQDFIDSANKKNKN